MAPVEFEKELRKRLHSREISPGADAWERIAARLDDEGQGGRRSPRWWMGVAAAGIVLLAALVFFWEREDSLPGTEELVETPVQEPVTPREVPQTPSAEPKPDPRREAMALAGEEVQETSAGDQQPAATEASADRPGAASLASVEELPDKDSARMEDLARELDALAGRIASADPSGQAVSDAEIDVLLERAGQAIAAQERPEGQALVDPSALLAQAEEELDQTFREKIMEKIKSGVTRLRTAVAQKQ